VPNLQGSTAAGEIHSFQTAWFNNAASVRKYRYLEVRSRQQSRRYEPRTETIGILQPHSDPTQSVLVCDTIPRRVAIIGTIHRIVRLISSQPYLHAYFNILVVTCQYDV